MSEWDVPGSDQPGFDQSGFDPLSEFEGRWGTALAQRYLPLRRSRAERYECVRGALIIGPFVHAGEAYAHGVLGELLRGAAPGRVYCRAAVRFADDTWIVPDLAVLRARPAEDAWVAPAELLVPVEFTVFGARRPDGIDRLALCAAEKVPWYLRIEVARNERTAYVRMDRLAGDGYVEHAAAHEGQRFAVHEPFRLDFDPADLLEPR